MLRPPTIAVIIPNWNDAKYIPCCLRSILEQDAPPDQLIVVDDASTDNSVDIIRLMIAHRPSAQLLVNSANLGVYGAIDVGLRHVTSDYVLFLSANDFVLPGIFHKARSCIAPSPGVGLWSAMAWLVNEDNAVIRLHTSPVIAVQDKVFSADECIKLAYRAGNWFTGSTLMYRRDALDSAGGFDPAYGGMSDLITAWIVASRYGAAYSPEPLAAFRIHSGSYTSSTLSIISSLEKMLARLRQLGPVLSPRLFSSAFVDRTILRFRFAALRKSGGLTMQDIAAHLEGWKSVLLRGINYVVPRNMRTIRIAAGFLILLPFDVVSTLIYRVLGWSIVRLRFRQPAVGVGRQG